MNLKKLFAGIAVMGATLGFFGNNGAQAQTKQTVKQDTTIKYKPQVVKDAQGRVVKEVERKKEIKETQSSSSKKTGQETKTVEKARPYTRSELLEQYKARRAKMTPEQRAQEDADYRKNKAAIDAAVAKKRKVETVTVPVGPLSLVDSTALNKQVRDSIIINNYIYKDSIVYQDRLVPVVQTPSKEPRRPWIASAGAMVSSSLDKGSIYKGVATPGVFAAIQTPALAGSGIGSLVSVRAEVNAQFAKPVASATMNQSCNCVTIGTFNAAGSGPRYGGMLTAHIGKTFNLNRYIDVTPNVFVGGAFQTRDKFTMEKGKEWTPQQKKEQSTAFGVAGAGITVYGDFGGNPQRGLGVIFTANAMTTTQKAAHQNPYTGPVPNPGYGSEVQSGRSLSLQDKFNVSGRVGLAYKF